MQWNAEVYFQFYSENVAKIAQCQMLFEYHLLRCLIHLSEPTDILLMLQRFKNIHLKDVYFGFFCLWVY